MTDEKHTISAALQTLNMLKEIANEIDYIFERAAGNGLRSEYNSGYKAGVADADGVVLNVITRIENILPDGADGPLAVTLNDYQTEALRTAIYKNPVIYPTIGLTGEAGEVADKVKKVLRDHNGVFENEDLRRGIALELGDVLWYVAALARDLEFSLQEVAGLNINKLRSRASRGKLSGSGDER